MQRLRRRAASHDRDAGISLAEVVVSLMVASLVFLALGATMIRTMAASRFARTNQQSADLLSERIESVRSLDYAAAQMVTSDLAGDTLITTVGSNRCFNPGSGPEMIVHGTSGSVNPHISTPSGPNSAVRNKVLYTVKTYVTQPTAGACGTANTEASGVTFKRLTVIVEWVQNNQTRRRYSQTLLTETRRGLPLPRYNWGASVTQTASPGGYFALPATLNNLGARDSWNLSISPGTWTWYVDENGDGVKQSTEVTVLSDSDGNGQPDTGLLEPNQLMNVIAYRPVLFNESPSTFNATLTARSIAQPTAASATKSFTDALTIGSWASIMGACTSTPTNCNWKQYYFHNSDTQPATPTTPISTATQPFGVMRVNQSVPISTSLWNFSTDVSANHSLGRHIAMSAGASGNTCSTAGCIPISQVAPFLYAVPNGYALAPNMKWLAVLYLRSPNSSVQPKLSVTIGYHSTSIGADAFNVLSTGTCPSPWGTLFGGAAINCLDIGPDDNYDGYVVSGTMPSSIPANTPGNNKWLDIRVVSGVSGVDLAYDSTAYPSFVILPVISPASG